MNIVLNETALQLLLESEAGPVGREIRERAERVLEGSRRRVGIIMQRSSVNVAADVDLELRPDLSAVIGIRDVGSISRYLAAKEARERVWLVPALAEVFPV